MKAQRQAPSLGRVLTRAYARAVVAVSVTIIVVGTTVAGVVVVRMDDQSARAQARTLGSELRNHAADPPAALDALVQHELDESRWFGRSVGVWRGGRQIGASVEEGRLRGWADRDPGCHTTIVGGWTRVCIVPGDDGATTIVTASSLTPVLRGLWPVAGSIAVVGVIVSALFGLRARSVVLRGLTPLAKFEATVAALPAEAPGRPVPESWGAIEVDALARTFNALMSRIAVAVETEQRFVANAAHELRSPLTRLWGQLQLMSADASREDGARLAMAARTCEELVRTTEALLALARNQAGEAETVDLGEIVQTLWSKLEELPRRRVSISADEPVLARGSEALLSLAIANLVDNALKYAEGPVAIDVKSAGQRSAVVVSDRGPGIPPDELDRVRQPFSRGRRQAVRPGTGLGLALADHVARLHGGALVLRNVPAGGLSAEIHVAPWTPQARRSTDVQDSLRSFC